MKDRDEEKVPARSDTFTAVTFFIAAMFLNCFTLNFTHFRMPDPRETPPLRDVGFDFIPIIRLQWITDSMLGFFNVVVVVMWLHSHYVEGNHAKARYMWVKYFMVWGYCMMMRGFSILLTSLPATENHCQNPREIRSIWVNTVTGFFSFGGKNVHCGDLLFSGHTINIVNAYWMVSFYARRFTPLVLSTGVCACICLFLIIASRSHYTIDVYIACCITTLSFKATPETIPPFLSPISAFWSKLLGDYDTPRRRLTEEGQSPV